MTVVGYQVVARVRVDGFLPPGKSLRPILCVSDTHLLPKDEPYGCDAPEALVDLLRRHQDHQVYVLGDMIESLIKPERLGMALARSARLGAVFAQLRKHPGLRIVPGNHDSFAHDFIRRAFGDNCFWKGGFRIGRLTFVHGHENSPHPLDGLKGLAHTALPIGYMLQKIGAYRDDGLASNEVISRWYNERGAFVVFGHTHLPAVESRFANTGCFLRHSRTFVTIRDGELRLSKWRLA